MKSLSEIDWFSRMTVLAVMALVIKVVMMAAAFFLPVAGIDGVPYQPASIYDGYHPSRLFALAGKKGPEPKKQAPVYKLDRLTLKAIYDAVASPFIVVEDNRKTVLISKGETYKGYRLIEVHPDRAVFEKGGRHYEIRFKESKVKGSTITQAAPEIINEGEAVFIKRNEIRHYARHYDDIWKNVKIKEVIKNRHLQGFRVTWVKKGSVFEKVGLRKGDIIIGANDKKFKSLSQVFKLYNNMDKIDSMKLTIIRDNEERELEYEIFE